MFLISENDLERKLVILSANFIIHGFELKFKFLIAITFVLKFYIIMSFKEGIYDCIH